MKLTQPRVSYARRYSHRTGKLTIPISGRTRTTLELAPDATQAEAIEPGQGNGFTSYNKLS